MDSSNSTTRHAAGALLNALDDDTVRPGLLGLLVVLALTAATALLLRSFTRQLKKVDFETGDPDPDAATAPTTETTSDPRSDDPETPSDHASDDPGRTP